MKMIPTILFFWLSVMSMASLPLKEDTAVTVLIGPFVDYADGKTVLSDNDDFDPDDIVIRLVKGSTESTLTLTKTGGSNNINLTGYGMATLTLTASDIDTAGQLLLTVCDAVVDTYPTETILPFAKTYTVYPSNVYDSLFADNTGISKFDETSDTVTTDSASREASKADVSALSTLSASDVRTQVDASIVFYRLDHLLLTGASLTDIVADQTIFAWLMSIDGDISDYNDDTDSNEGVRNQVDLIPTKPSTPGM